MDKQGIGISAATTWALQTNASGAKVITKQKRQRKATSGVVEMDLKNNKGVLKNKENLDWDRQHGTSVEFIIDGRIQLNGEAGLINYIKGNVLVNPHMKLTYRLPGMSKAETIDRVTKECPTIPDSVEPHPHTMKLGEFLSHSKLFGGVKTKAWLRKGFSRVSDKVIGDIATNGFAKKKLETPLNKLSETDIRNLFAAIQKTDLMAPATSSVLSIGEEGLSKSIQRIGEIDFFSVVTRRPTICDFKPVQIEVAVARLQTGSVEDSEDQVHVLRFANRVPLQFDKGACAIVKSINTVNWRNYGLRQPRNSLPLGPYIICVSMVSPFIKFKNASKETIDASDELVEEIRRALMQAGQRLSRHIRREHKEAELEQKIQHIEKFGPILVETLARIVGAPSTRKEAATEGLLKILGRDTKATKKQLVEAEEKLEKQKEKRRLRLGIEDEEELRLKKEAAQAARNASEADGELEAEEASQSQSPKGKRTTTTKTKKALKNRPSKSTKKKVATKKKSSTKKKSNTNKKNVAKKKKSKSTVKKPKKKAKAKPTKKKKGRA